MGSVPVLAAATLGVLLLQTPRQVPDIYFTPTRHAIADAMLALAGTGPSDVVFDLGSGDGRVVILAAQKYGARGIGVELDPTLVALSRQVAREGDIAHRVNFLEGNLFDADVSSATVVTLYLNGSTNRRLEPKLRSELRPGTRIVSHQFPIGNWTPERQITVEGATLLLWIVPTR